MGLFEFLMILLSVIIGLALTELLTGVASLLRVRETVRFYWVHVVLQFGIFFALLQQWWESWDLAEIEVISFGAVGFYPGKQPLAKIELEWISEAAFDPKRPFETRPDSAPLCSSVLRAGANPAAIFLG
jgi:hypothetical protein